MAAPTETASGPDFGQGIARDQVPLEGTLAGRVGDEAVLLSRLGGMLYAVSATCTHYGAPLADGLATAGVVRCPWHHACFDLRTGEALRAPAISALDRWRVEEEGDRVVVRGKIGGADVRRALPDEVRRVVIVGGGAAGFACAEMLRRRGYDGTLTMLSADADPPYDRPNLSKDFLAGKAPDEWMPLKGDDFYAEQEIDLRLEVEVIAIDPQARTVTTKTGDTFAFDRLLLATGAEPIRPDIAGFDRPEAHLLRSFADARAIAARAEKGRRAAVLGSGFIGLEAAAALSRRGLEVTVVSHDHLPMGQPFGDEVGSLLRTLHEENGVAFRLGRTAKSFEGDALVLDDGTRVDADFVLIGLGVRPRIELARAAGLLVDNGVVVDAKLETSHPGIYAAGDIAAYPDGATGKRLRIEHWVVAERQGQTVAANMLGSGEAYGAPPFFWTEQHGLAIHYVGHAESADIRIEGSVADREFSACYFEGEALGAFLTVGRDRDSLEAEAWLEKVEGIAPPACLRAGGG
ncbi:MAG: hypothetical protein QOH47_99 [Sphingomonadales bacterium]|jgi:NADPH-dependent 2,4-dienoyl-CoA reductase/sulfur reductase-like enzyme/nitrite reductase/ring-hydroxylating ferredoxin subunit|nr:hypothetical protein [Sphingomonadales bacterium]